MRLSIVQSSPRGPTLAGRAPGHQHFAAQESLRDTPMTLSICASDLDVCIPWRGVLAHAPPPPPPDRPSVAGPNLTDTFNTFYNITQRGGPSARALATIAGRGPVPRDRSRSTSASGGNREAAARLHRGRPLVAPRATRPATLRSGKRRAPAGPSAPGGHPRLGRRPGPAR